MCKHVWIWMCTIQRLWMFWMMIEKFGFYLKKITGLKLPTWMKNCFNFWLAQNYEFFQIKLCLILSWIHLCRNVLLIFVLSFLLWKHRLRLLSGWLQIFTQKMSKPYESGVNNWKHQKEQKETFNYLKPITSLFSR